MLQAINTKIIIAVLAALGAMTALLVHERNASQRAALNAEKAAKAAQLLEEQELEHNSQRDANQKEWNQQRRVAEHEQKHHNVNNSAKDNTWVKALP